MPWIIRNGIGWETKRVIIASGMGLILLLVCFKLMTSIPYQQMSMQKRETFLWTLPQSILSFGESAETSPKIEVLECEYAELSPLEVGAEFLENLPVSLPDDHSKPLEIILKEPWVCELQQFLSKVDPNTRLVNMIAANSNFTEPLLNWLIAAHLRLEIPMIDVIVISLDPPLYEFLTARGIPSLLITPDSVMFTEDFPEVYHMHNGFYQTRMMVMRLINHWGYNTASYDTDAILLKNPREIYDSVEYEDFDIIGSYAILFPPELHKKWGATLCNGAWMVRSNPRTETKITIFDDRLYFQSCFWENVCLTSNTGCERGMDQCKVNYALDRMNLTWISTSHSIKEFNLDMEWAAFGDIYLVILPLRSVCRQRFCEEEYLEDYYIWHKGSRDKTTEAKRESVSVGGLWWLSDNWRDLSRLYPRSSGLEWLSLVTNHTSL